VASVLSQQPFPYIEGGFALRRASRHRSADVIPVLASGAVDKFEDLPPSLRQNIDIIDEPLTRTKGRSPIWSDAEIDDVIAFLQTLPTAT
jgi:hypothetical protein